MKKIFCIILTLVLLVNMVPPTNAYASDTTAETGDVTVTGTNSFGSLLSEVIETEQQESEAEHAAGYSIVDLSIAYGVATVEYSTLEEAILVVALYSEDGQQLLLSGKTAASPDESVATVELTGEMPEYFLASAYLVDTYDYAPLCEAYDTPMYTQEMQELLASTVEDYDPDRVLQLDESTQTNFAVYNETTKVIEPKEQANIVVKADEETGTYIIENADESFTSLKAGDIVAYPYGEDEILLAKVGTITVEGTTVTIIGADLEIEEVFSHVKVETDADTEDMEVTPPDEEGVIFEGLIEEETGEVDPTAWEGGSSKEHYLAYKFLDKSYGNGSSVKLNGQIGVGVKTKFNYYISTKRQFVELKTDIRIEAKLSAKGELKGEILLGVYRCPVAGVNIYFTPSFIFEASGEVEVSLSIGVTRGVSYQSGKGLKILDTKPYVEADFKIKATIFVGFNLNGRLELGVRVWRVKLMLLEITADIPFGVELEAELKGLNHEKLETDAETIHSCNNCVDMELKVKLEIEAKLSLLNDKFYCKKKWTGEFKMGDLYWSIDYGEFGWGECPHFSYRVTVCVQDQDGNPLQGSEVIAYQLGASDRVLGTTNSNGVVVSYLEHNVYVFTATLDEVKANKTETITNPCKIHINLGLPEEEPAPDWTEREDEFVDYGAVIASGNCGAEGDNVTWELYQEGILVISGTGLMEKYIWADDVPWDDYDSSIKTVLIESGVTSIGANAFSGCTSLTSVTISDSVTSVGDYAFNGCNSLEKTQYDNAYYLGNSNNPYLVLHKAVSRDISACSVHESTKVIADRAFYDCDSLNDITIPHSVITIGIRSFSGCDALLNITIPDSVTNIDAYAFEGCGLCEVTIPGSVGTIGAYAFYRCVKLRNVTIEKGVTAIGGRAFSGCGLLTSISVPDSMTTISDDAFVSSPNLKYNEYGNGKYIGNEENPYVFLFAANSRDITTCTINRQTKVINQRALYECTKLTSITIPDSVTSIGVCAFYGCISLTNVAIGNGVTSIGGMAFAHSTSLTSITIPDSVTSIGHSAFYCCDSLTSVTIGNGVSSIGDGAFVNCESLSRVNISDIAAWCTIKFESESANPFYEASRLYLNGERIDKLMIPDGVKVIGDYAFYNCWFTSVTISDSVASIGAYAFEYGHDLRSVTMGNGVTSIGNYAFSDCVALTSINIPNSVTSIGYGVFEGCNNLTGIWVDSGNPNYSNDERGVLFNKDKTILIRAPGDIRGKYDIPPTVTRINVSAFYHCLGLNDIAIPGSVVDIDPYAFYLCYRLNSVTIGNGVTSIGTNAFYDCTNLTSITFKGDAPAFKYNPFGGVTATAYYPSGNTTWTADVMQNYGGTITWVAYDPSQTNDLQSHTITDQSSSDTLIPNSVYDGDVTIGDVNGVTTRTASFSELVPGRSYVLLVLASLDVEDYLAAPNLLFIDQGVANAEGNLTFTYVLAEDVGISYVMACGASDKDLADAEITFPTMLAGEEPRAVAPVVTYQGKVLTEGKDYVLLGRTDYTTSGKYTCFIRGIRDYTGLVECQYMVYADQNMICYGDVNGDGEINGRDVIQLRKYMANFDYDTGLSTVEVSAGADVNGDGQINGRDVILLRKYMANYDYDTGESTVVLGPP